MKLVEKFYNKLKEYREHECKTALPRKTVIKFLMARKFDYKRACELYLSHEDMRNKEDLHDIDVNDPAFIKEINTGKFTILSGRDESGAGIALFTAKYHIPSETTHQIVLKALIYLLDAALESLETQRHGVVFVYDMSESKYTNFDYDLSIKILTMLKGAYPARLKKVLIVTAPLWFRAPFKILRLFVREKLRDRVYTVNQYQLLEHIPPDSLPHKFGGNVKLDHRYWLDVCAAIHQSTDPGLISSYFMSRNVTGSSSRSSSSQSGFNHTEAMFDSEDSKDTVSEKQSTEGGEKEDVSEVEKEVNVMKDKGHKQCHDKTDIYTAESDNRQSESIHGPEQDGFTVSELLEYMKNKGKKGLYEEYSCIRKEPPSGTFNVCKAKYNQSKNRYSDVLCYDHSRVHLPPQDDDPSSDYINANFVDGYMQKDAYICSQGPFQKTFGDFWRMIWLTQCVTIVMTTRTVEKGRPKCGQYWPLDNGEEQHDEFIITNTAIEQNAEYNITALTVNNTCTGESRRIKHLQFTAWPDYSTPPAAGFLHFILRVRACQKESVALLQPAWTGHSNGPPLVCHCSAGIGRTGTFICTDISLYRLEHIGTVNIRETVCKIRSQRAFSIQMPDQYVFCFHAIIDYAVRNQLLDSDTSVFDDSDSDFA